MKKIDAAWITLNRSCNLRCSFCYTNTLGFKKEDTLELKDIKQIIGFLKDAKINHVTLIGGEPTVYKYLPETIKLLLDNGISYTIVTNGIRLTNENYLNILLDSGLSKCSMVSISLKETNEDLYEKVTGSRSYEKTYEAFKKMKELDIPSSFSFVVTPENVNRYLDGMKKFIDISGDSYCGLSICYDFNQSPNKDPEYLSKNDYFDFIKEFIKTIPELDRLTRGKWNLQNGIPRCLIDDEDYEIIKEHSTVGCQLIDGWGIVFDTDKSLIPCNSTYNTKLGKLGTDFNNYEEFEKLYNEGLLGKKLKYLRSLPIPICKACSLIHDCKGACLAYWSQFTFKDVIDFKYEHNFGIKCFNEKKLLSNNRSLVGTHGTGYYKAKSILEKGVIESSHNDYLQDSYNFAFLLKPSYKDADHPFGLNYLISKYTKEEITNVFPFDSGYYLKNNDANHYLSIINYLLPFDKLDDFIYKKFGSLNDYYQSNYFFIPTNHVDNELLNIYKKGKKRGNPDMRVTSIELSCANDHHIDDGNLLAMAAPIINFALLKGKTTMIPYSSFDCFNMGLDYRVKAYYIKKGILK